MQTHDIISIFGFIIISIGIGVQKIFTEKDKTIVIILAGLTTVLIIINAPIFSMVVLLCNIIFIANRIIKSRKEKLTA